MKNTNDKRAEKFYDLKMQGYTLQEIADTYFLTPQRIGQIIRDYERKYQVPPAIQKPIHSQSVRKSDRKAEEYRNLRLKGVTVEDIAGIYGVSRQCIDQSIKRYEHKYNLPNCTQSKRELTRSAKQADREEFREELAFERRDQHKNAVSTFQLDAHHVGRFLNTLNTKYNRNVLYGFDGKSKSNPRRRKDGTPYPSQNKPTNITINVNRQRIKVHSWVLQQNGITLNRGQSCHHIDGDVTNNMLENLQVVSNKEHGYITQQKQREKRLKNFGVNQIFLDFGA